MVVCYPTMLKNKQMLPLPMMFTVFLIYGKKKIIIHIYTTFPRFMIFFFAKPLNIVQLEHWACGW
jgi:hypothetical protein